ncbi:hypothetical protein PUS82_09690 [Cytobacillus firmus]|uniref:hypothetical protein n=1 Tax=Cytobacillus firmus TaxID=1399 RepID=UPI00237B42EE|nr:hypothetical protein [Cytobacillus firmus]MDD9311570.1 hypothetical protein [Cytobacillus firmus]
MRSFYFLGISLLLLTGCSFEENNAKFVKAKEPTYEEDAQKSNFTKIPPGNPSEQTPTFTIKEKVKDVLMLYEVRGERGKFGFLDIPLIKGKDNQLDWLFWTSDYQQLTGNLKIKGKNQETGQDFVSKGKIINKEKSIKDLPKKYKPLPLNDNNSFNAAKENEFTPASIASTSISFPESGMWELEVLVNEKVIGSMKVFVKDSEAGIHYLKN